MTAGARIERVRSDSAVGHVGEPVDGEDLILVEPLEQIAQCS